MTRADTAWYDQRRRKCQCCKGSGRRTKYISLYYSKEIVCLTCGGSGSVGGKRR